MDKKHFQYVQPSAPIGGPTSNFRHANQILIALWASAVE